jgi:hypothetical protein
MSAVASAFPLAGVPRVNLLPPVEVERRRRGSLVRAWAWAVVAAMLVAFLVVVGAFAFKFVADQALVAEQARTNALLTELSSLSAVSGALAMEGELTAFRQDAMGADFAWTPVVATLASTLPTDVQLVGFDLVTGGVPQTDDPTVEAGLVGTLTLESPNSIDLPTTIRDLRALESVAMVDGRALSSGQRTVGTYRYELEVALDQSIYSGDFRATEGAE